MNTGGPFMALLIGLMMVAMSLVSIISGSGGHLFGIFDDSPVADLIGWIDLPLGIIICVLAVCSLRSVREKLKKYIEENAAKAGAEQDGTQLEKRASLPEEKKDA
jgi:hypothetical protein